MRIGEVIRINRKKENLTQEQIANYLNISAPAVNKWENGISYPNYRFNHKYGK
jgi:transcriptional regulator with XRE-family HTH domain